MPSIENRYGPELLRCQPRSFLDWQRQVMPLWIAIPIWLVSLVCGLLFVILLAGVAALAANKIDPALAQPIFWAAMAALGISYVGMMIWLPQHDYLILYKLGFRYQISGLFWRGSVAFADLESLVLGRNPSIVENLADALHPQNAKMADFLRMKCVVLRYKWGREVVIEHFLLRFRAEHTIQLLELIAANHPDLAKVRS